MNKIVKRKLARPRSKQLNESLVKFQGVKCFQIGLWAVHDPNMGGKQIDRPQQEEP